MVAAGESHSLALFDPIVLGPNIYVWGNNEVGQLGAEASVDDCLEGTKGLCPLLILESAESVAAGAHHSLLALNEAKDAGAGLTYLAAAGLNATGQLGFRSDDPSVPSFSAVPFTDGRMFDPRGFDNAHGRLAAGGLHSLALDSDGSLWAWGSNEWGQVGVGELSQRVWAPARIADAADWVHVAAGPMHSLAIKQDGSLWSWGDNGSGQLGDPASFTQGQALPVQIGFPSDWARPSE